MKYGIYCVKDELVGYDRPILFDNDLAAIRSFSMAIDDESSFVYKHPNDYSMWRVGTFDTDTGIIDVESIKKVTDALQLIKRKE